MLTPQKDSAVPKLLAESPRLKKPRGVEIEKSVRGGGEKV